MKALYAFAISMALVGPVVAADIPGGTPTSKTGWKIICISKSVQG